MVEGLYAVALALGLLFTGFIIMIYWLCDRLNTVAQRLLYD